MKEMKLLIIPGSIRKDSLNLRLSDVVLKQAAQLGHAATLLDPLTLDIPILNQDASDQQLFPLPVSAARKALLSHDAWIFITPEYNGSIPGGLKNLIDWLSRPEKDQPVKNIFQMKPVAIMSASVSIYGGLRALLHLRQILSILQADIIPYEKTLPKADEVFKTIEGINPHLAAIDKIIATLAERSASKHS